MSMMVSQANESVLVWFPLDELKKYDYSCGQRYEPSRQATFQNTLDIRNNYAIGDRDVLTVNKKSVMNRDHSASAHNG